MELSFCAITDKYQSCRANYDFHHKILLLLLFMPGKIQLKNLSVYYSRPEIIRATAEQIAKDFEIFGEKIEFSGNAGTAYEELKSQILPVVTRMMRQNSGKFLSLLYRIDVSEKTVKELSGESPEKFEEIVTELIIERELKKVIIRKYYRQ